MFLQCSKAEIWTSYSKSYAVPVKKSFKHDRHGYFMPNVYALKRNKDAEL